MLTDLGTLLEGFEVVVVVGISGVVLSRTEAEEFAFGMGPLVSFLGHGTLRVGDEDEEPTDS
jgi:hypothetical protein